MQRSKGNQNTSKWDTALTFFPKQNNNVFQPLKAYQLCAFRLLSSDIARDVLFSMLDVRSQHQLSKLSHEHQTFFKDKLSASQLLQLLVTYTIQGELNNKLKERMLNETIYYTLSENNKEISFNTDGQGQQVENHIIRLAYIILKEHPEFMTKKSGVMTPLEYICRSGNFLMCELISQLIPGGQKKVFEQLAILKKEETNYNVALMPVLTANQSIEDLQYNQMIFLPAQHALPRSIPEDAILFQMLDQQIQTYRMKNNIVQADKTVMLDSKIFPILLTEKQLQITAASHPKLFEEIRVICAYPPRLENKPSLVQQIDENGNISKLIQWDNMNGLWQQRELVWCNEISLKQIPNDYLFYTYNIPKGRLEISINPNTNSFNCMVSDLPNEITITKEALNIKDISNLEAVSLLKDEIIKIIATRSDFLLNYTLLTDTEKQLLMQLPFPPSTSNHPHIIESPALTDIYSILKLGHPIIYDLRQYIQGASTFNSHYPATFSLTPNLVKKHNEDVSKLIRRPQLLMPAWLGQVWCADTALYHLKGVLRENFYIYDVILKTKNRKLQVIDAVTSEISSSGDRSFNRKYKHFFDPSIMNGEIIIRNNFPMAETQPIERIGQTINDRTVMTVLNSWINAKFKTMLQPTLTNEQDNNSTHQISRKA